MTRDQAVATIQRLLGFRSDKSSEIIEALKNAQRELEHGTVLPWFLLSEMTTSTTVSGEERLAVPSDFLREYDPSALYVLEDDGTYTPLEKADPEWLREYVTGTGRPRAYALTGNYFRLFPTPDDAYTIKMIYYQADTVLDSNVENKWLKNAAELLYSRAGKEMAYSLRDGEAAKIFAAMERVAYNEMLRYSVARDQANQQPMMGGPD